MKRILAGFVVLAAIGCAANESAVVGRWKGDVRMSDKAKAQPLSNLASGFAATLTLNLKADHTYEGMAFVAPVEGTWSMAGDRISLVPKKVLGFDAASANGRGKNSFDPTKPSTLVFDGKELRPEGSTPGGDTDFVFVKAE